jgi:hypothetical protein
MNQILLAAWQLLLRASDALLRPFQTAPYPEPKRCDHDWRVLRDWHLDELATSLNDDGWKRERRLLVCHLCHEKDWQTRKIDMTADLPRVDQQDVRFL